jgi:hypothetical protein
MSKVHTPEPRSERKNKRKRWIALGILGVFALAGGAYAYFSTTGAGTTDATVGTSTALVIHGVVTPATGGLVPGGPAATIAFTVDNASTGDQQVGTVTLDSVEAFTTSGHTVAVPGCDAAWFTMTPVAQNQDIPGSSNAVSLTNDGSLAFANVASNQDACKNRHLLLTFSSN